MQLVQKPEPQFHALPEHNPPPHPPRHALASGAPGWAEAPAQTSPCAGASSLNLTAEGESRFLPQAMEYTSAVGGISGETYYNSCPCSAPGLAGEWLTARAGRGAGSDSAPDDRLGALPGRRAPALLIGKRWVTNGAREPHSFLKLLFWDTAGQCDSLKMLHLFGNVVSSSCGFLWIWKRCRYPDPHCIVFTVLWICF